MMLTSLHECQIGLLVSAARIAGKKEIKKEREKERKELSGDIQSTLYALLSSVSYSRGRSSSLNVALFKTTACILLLSLIGLNLCYIRRNAL